MSDPAQNTVAAGDRQTALRAFLKRRHPEYWNNLAHWCFCQDTYDGGRKWFVDNNIFRYIKEGDTEYSDRVGRAYRFNHTRETVDLVQKYIFKSPVERNEDDAPGYVTEFWKEATDTGLSIDQYAKLLSTLASIHGMIWVVVDSSKSADVVSVADAKAQGARSYSYAVKPEDALDMGFNSDGTLAWILLREYLRDDQDPIYATGGVKEQFRLWKMDGWELYEIVKDPDGDETKDEVILADQGAYDIGLVPVFAVRHVVGDNRYAAPGLISDIAYLDRACANYLSNLDAIIQDQTFSQLAMPAQAMLPGEDPYKRLLEMGTKRVFVFDGEGGGKPEYLSPDPRQANLILVVINKIINEIYHTIGMAGERTKQDNAAGIDNSSGVAKAYDFERMNSLLTSKADALEDAENKLVMLVRAWNHDTKEDETLESLVKYPDTFDVRSLFDEFTVAERLALIDAPETVRREQMKQVIDKLFPRIAEALRKAMEDDLKTWPPQLDLQTVGTVGPGGGKPPIVGVKKGGAQPAAKNPGTQRRQGQVTSETK